MQLCIGVSLKEINQRKDKCVLPVFLAAYQSGVRVVSQAGLRYAWV